MSDVFLENAPAFWRRALPALPIELGTKKPPSSLTGWTGYLSNLPSESKQTDWLEKYGSCGIGLLLGSEVTPGHYLAALDIDDDRLVQPTLALFGIEDDLVGKKGMKGLSFFGLTTKSDPIKSTTITGNGELGNIDFLAAGRQTVMPPSIHPDKLAYKVVGQSILDADFSKLPVIESRYLKIMKAVYGSSYVLSIISGQDTHDPGVALVAIMVIADATDEEIIRFFKALLPPDYKGNSLDELPGWIASAREKGFGNKTQKSPNLAAEILKHAEGCILGIFNDGDTAYVNFVCDDGTVSSPVCSQKTRNRIRHHVQNCLGRPVPGGPLTDAIATLEVKALFESPKYEVNTRIAGGNEMVEIDLGDVDGLRAFEAWGFPSGAFGDS